MKERLKLYQHLMNGFSYMLPFVVAGGLLIAISKHSLLTDNIPYLTNVGEIVLSFAFPVLAGFIAFAIADRPGIAPGVAAGALALFGGSGFIGAIIGGFAAGYIIEALKFISKIVPKSLNGLKPILIFPFFGVLLTALFMLPVNIALKPIVTYIALMIESLESYQLIIVSVILGGLMAVDLGGPINKIAYLFGVITLVNGEPSMIMASIMVAGMIPPLGIALAVLLFKQDFDDMDKKLAKTNWFMGLSFITEGAIPFKQKYHSSIHFPMMVGSMLGAMMSAMLSVSVPAPHGGIFVLPLMEQAWGFLIALLAGIILSTVLMKLCMMMREKHD